MKPRPVICFLKLNPISALAAFCLKPFFRIVYWRSIRTPHLVLKCFERLDSQSYFSYDEWQVLSDEIHESWKEVANRWVESESLFFSVNGLSIDFMPLWLQQLAIEYDDHVRFLRLIERWQAASKISAPFYIAGASLFSQAAKFYIRFPHLSMSEFGFLLFLEGFWGFTFNIILTIKQASRICINLFRNSYRGYRFRFFWTGIALSEISCNVDAFDFSFLVRRGLMHRNDCLFFLPPISDVKIKKTLKERRLYWIEAQDWPALLCAKEKVFALLSLMGIWLRILVEKRTNCIRWAVLEFAIKSAPWVLLTNRYDPEVYVSSISAIWPEEPAVAVMNAMNIRTVNWYYSWNVFSRTETEPSFKDQHIILSIQACKEVCVWSALVQRWCEERLVLAHQYQPSFHVTGPLMCGDARLLSCDPSSLRSEIGYVDSGKVYIAVFDTPPHSDEGRLNKGHAGLLYNLEVQERFYNDIRFLLTQIPNTCLVLKLKRSIRDPLRSHCRVAQRLIAGEDPLVSKSRLILLTHDADPYLPIGMADACIGLPFSSPILAAIYTEKIGIFHDPCNQFRYFYPKECTTMMTHSGEELVDMFRRLLSSRDEKNRYLAKLKPLREQMTTRDHVDPAITFADFLLKSNSRVMNFNQKYVSVENKIVAG